MKIWKLTPINPDFAGWCCSCYKGDAIVRAEDPDKAREIVALRFLELTEKTSSCQKTPSSPWYDPAVVECIELDNSKYSKDGEPELLEPKDFVE